MYKQILTPDKKNHSIILPKNLYGKKVEVTVVEIEDEELPVRVKGAKNFLDDIEPIPDFPGIDEIRKDGWPERW
jgi:hypothetical protein